MMFLSLSLFAQKKYKFVDTAPSIKTLEYFYEKVKADEVDNFLILKGFKFAGSSKRGDTVSITYRRPNSDTRIGLDLENDLKIDVYYYTTIDIAAQYIISTAKASGYRMSKNEVLNNSIETTYEKPPFFMMFFKTFYPDDNTSSYSIILGKRKN